MCYCSRSATRALSWKKVAPELDDKLLSTTGALIHEDIEPELLDRLACVLLCEEVAACTTGALTLEDACENLAPERD